ncbi:MULTISPECIES: ISL3 family transposase [Pseudonocardia]|uniref:Transposase n=2 Tax=Pseudonocardia TaxID=1847 RepID=A0A1Y2MHB0_PSEAH|nr:MULTISPECIES: ISL3 family transposase [Pseudonocardia]OSY34481.1 Transposase [Pseudonocardia autotrophica]TDN75508.1 transposase [Pseudonocardia autotrophica]BBF99476.1 ISL3 family transposase [Pseudonocardia autotrophica]GEC29667.1 ISL3 family transposase [Pseudonocardia saturnea]
MPQPTSPPAQIVADTIIRTVELGVRITDAALDGDTTVLWCELLTDGPGVCPGCGLVGVYRDTVERRVTDVPVVGHPLQLRVRVPRYRCVHDGCVREVFAHDSRRLARPGWTTTRRCAAYVLGRLAVDKATVSAVARELGRSWDTVNSIAVTATEQLLLTAGPARLDGVRVIGVDEHKWAHVFGADGDGFVTVITDLTAVVAGHGPARLLDLVAGRSAAAMTTWLNARDQAFRDGVRIVAMDGFGGYKNAATTALPDAVTVMDPFHVVALAGHKLDLCRQRVQQDTLGHRGRTGDPLYRERRTLRTRLGLLTDKQRTRLEAVFAGDQHVAVEVTWWAYQQIIAAYATTDRRRGKTELASVIDRLRGELPAGLAELATLGRTLHRRREDVLAYFDHRASNGPTEAINGRLEALRRNALGFRNLINYRIRSLLHCGALAL